MTKTTLDEKASVQLESALEAGRLRICNGDGVEDFVLTDVNETVQFSFGEHELENLKRIVRELERTVLDSDRTLTWIAFVNDGAAVKGPYTTEMAALESIPEDHRSFHIEPRYLRESAGDCVAYDVSPTY